MEYHLLGKSELNISRIGFGTMSLELDNPQTAHILQEAVSGGINFFDTADLYQQGRNEILLGRVLKEYRKHVILATKVGNQWRPDGSGWDWNPSKKYILAAAEESLRRLQTDYIDLYQLHGGTIDDPVDDILEAFEHLKAAGKIRYYGISSIRQNVIREYVRRSDIASVMMQYSLLDRRPEEEMLPLLHSNHIGVLARGTVAKGMLISKPAEAYLNYSREQVEMLGEAIREISGSKWSPFQTAAAFVLAQPAVSSAVVGIRTKEQLQDAFHAFDKPDSASKQVQKLKELIPANRYSEHR